MDSGASDHVTSEWLATLFKVKPSSGSRIGVQCVAAKGNMMPNKGAKDVKVKTEEGHRCVFLRCRLQMSSCREDDIPERRREVGFQPARDARFEVDEEFRVCRTLGSVRSGWRGDPEHRLR